MGSSLVESFRSAADYAARVSDEAPALSIYYARSIDDVQPVLPAFADRADV